MKNVLSRFTVLLAVLAMVWPASTQETGKKSDPKPPAGPSQVMLENWNEVGGKLVAMAEDFPEDKYDFKPAPAERSFAEQLLHAANANYFFVNPATGKPMPAEEDPKRDQYKSKAEVVAFVRKAFDDAGSAIKTKGDSGLNDLITAPFGNRQVRISDLGWEMLEHAGEHYGQLVVYYRVAGLVPPASRPKK